MRDRVLKGPIAVAQQHADTSAATERSNHRDIEHMVVVEVSDRQLARADERIVVDGRFKCTVAISKQHADVLIVGHDNINLVIVVKISHRDESTGVRSWRRYGRLESSIAITEIYAEA